VVARTATHAYLNAAWPYIRERAARRTEALNDDPALDRAVCMQAGQRRSRPARGA